MLDNVISALREWKAWKRIEEAPDRIDGLERRVAELESRLRRAPGAACPSCGDYEYRVESSRPDPVMKDVGGIRRVMKCKSCGFSESVLVAPE